MKILTICKDVISRLQFSKSCPRLHGLYIEIAMGCWWMIIIKLEQKTNTVEPPLTNLAYLYEKVHLAGDHSFSTQAKFSEKTKGGRWVKNVSFSGNFAYILNE